MDKALFIEKMKDASSTINNDYCTDVIRNSLRNIKEEQNQKGTMNIIIVMEELAEFQQELSKTLRGKNNQISLIEEMADTYLGIKYIQEIFDISDETLAKAINVKLNRQNKRNSFVNKEDDIEK